MGSKKKTPLAGFASGVFDSRSKQSYLSASMLGAWTGPEPPAGFVPGSLGTAAICCACVALLDNLRFTVNRAPTEIQSTEECWRELKSKMDVEYLQLQQYVKFFAFIW
jgi:hypothetical protein